MHARALSRPLSQSGQLEKALAEAQMKISHVELQSEVLRQTSKQAWDLAQERDRCLYASVSVFACMHACMYVSTPDLNETLMPPPTAPSPPAPPLSVSF